MTEEIRLTKNTDDTIRIEQANDVIYCTPEQAINLAHRLLKFANEQGPFTEEIIQ